MCFKRKRKFLDIFKRLRHQDIFRREDRECQSPFCIYKCILIFRWHSKGCKVIVTKCDHRKLLLQIIEGRRKHAFVFIIFLFCDSIVRHKLLDQWDIVYLCIFVYICQEKTEYRKWLNMLFSAGEL